MKKRHCYLMRTRSGSDYNCQAVDAQPTSQPVQSAMPMEMDALDAAISSLDTNATATNDAMAQLLRGLVDTLTMNFNAALAKKDAQIQDLHSRVCKLEETCDELEQYSRRNTVRIRGIPEALNENTDALVKELAARKLEVPVVDHDIVRSHRVGRKEDDRRTPRDLIVRFTTHNTKVAVMRAARKLRGSSTFINEDMTRTRSTIAWEARNLKRDNKLTDTWTRDGIIFIKPDNLIKSFTSARAWKEFRGKL